PRIDSSKSTLGQHCLACKNRADHRFCCGCHMRPATGENVATHPKTCAAAYPIISILFTIAIADIIRFIFKIGNATRTTNSIKKSDVLKKIPPVQ
ncbi:hypothetical protein, partial [Burkholderia ubonensis]|uniref:hypothetical protein n=1 Tax=Burkholderia ubonensis TaxID=101571 RepID=UPI001E4E00B6